MANSIIMKDNGGALVTAKEEKATAAITPGDLVEFVSTGGIRRHATIGGAARAAFAVENSVIGKGIDDDYAANDAVKYVVAAPGVELYALLATGKSCSKGDFLESFGNGKLQVASTPIEGSNVAVALEAITGGGSPKRVKVEVV